HYVRRSGEVGRPAAPTRVTPPVPLSWLNPPCSPFTISGWSSENALEPTSPSSSPVQCPATIVRCGCGSTCLRILIASSIVIVPVPLSVAPDEPSHESKCADRSTYSFALAAPGSVATTLYTGCSPSSLPSRLRRSFGCWWF